MNPAFDSFNARNLPLLEIAERFVESPGFGVARQARHTVVLGPRGSGKTTLLKMLTPAAWRAWMKRHPSEKSLPFSSIYIPTDIHWHHQLLYSESVLAEAPIFFRRVSQASVTNSAMLAILDSFAFLAQELGQTREQEASVCRELASAWKLEGIIPAFEEVRLAVKRRIVLLAQLVNRAAIIRSKDAELREAPVWFDLDFLSIADHAITAFDTAYHRDQESRWALCFDELELAPAWLHEQLFKFPRSVSQKIYFKLSSSPDPDGAPSGNVTAINDVDVVRLWRASMIELRGFCSALTKAILERRGFGHTSPEVLFGYTDTSDVEQLPELTLEANKPYEVGSEEWHLIKEVASWDHSLRGVLQSKGIDPENPTASSGAARDTVLRKIKPIVSLRRKFAKPAKSGALMRRSRKSAEGYFGVPAIYDVTDGNPRRLIRLLEDLCDIAEVNGFLQIPPRAQSRAIQNVSFLYVDYLQTLPFSRSHIANWQVDVDVYSVLREIGRYFSSGLLLGPFPLDPAASFTVDHSTTDDLVRLLRIASFHGAIVKVDPSATGLVEEIRGKRYRLCYTLSPLFQLPLRLYDPINLSQCLQRFSTRQIRKTTTLAQSKGPTQLLIDDVR